MEHNIINTLNNGEQVTSTYVETYYNDHHCDFNQSSSRSILPNKPVITDDRVDKEWVSPSDLLIGIIELTPPFTSKITRGTTHEGILALGGEILEIEHADFVKYLADLIHDNDVAWKDILEHEKAAIAKKVKAKYEEILEKKNQIMKKEISKFYEKTLQELEDTVKCGVNNVLLSTHANVTLRLNEEIKIKLEKERKILETNMRSKYVLEVSKIKKYYELLLRNELNRNTHLIDQAVVERNDALQAFYRQIEAENITSTMYVMCTERKKCKIKHFITENYQSLELKEKLQKIKDKENVLNIFKGQEMHLSKINKAWEERIKKILQLFLKFISFSLKLLPEQTAFLLDFEKMVVLQLNEIQKQPAVTKQSSILIDDENLKNTYKFNTKDSEEEECKTDPFVIVGDLSDPVPPHYGSRETLPLDVDLPTIRLQRKFVYAKCHKFEEIKALLEAQRCKCSDIPVKEPTPSTSSKSEPSKSESATSITIDQESSNERLLLEDFYRYSQCPAKNCQDWVHKLSFPYLNSYLDFDEEKYERVKAVLGNIPKKEHSSELLNPKNIAYRELPFSVTKEPHHTVETQYSSQEDINVPKPVCPCLDDYIPPKQKDFCDRTRENTDKALIKILANRKYSMIRLMDKYPDLVKLFTDDSTDFQY